ncbi:Autoinducer 2 sensor kinase/phosphatase LuxQ [Planctomycetes bacterium Pla163]|uniref:histidine kinase n=2 Tax=Rohdeia mirabilis TaxID=2528008 RepID=A0A518D3J1_9BACT|nr:Autoinducer 2 sensor kinase/phosphatase LuxQ [Planctomycetes bacterium Pla163]
MSLPTTSLPPWSSPFVDDVQLTSALAGAAVALVVVALVRSLGRGARRDSAATRPSTAAGPSLAGDPSGERVDRSAGPERATGAEVALTHGGHFACRFRTDTTLTWVNAACCELWGRTAQDLVGSRWIERVEPAGAERAQRLLATLTSTTPTACDEQWVATDEGFVCVQWAYQALVDERGEVDEVFAIGTEITVLKNAIEQLGHSEARLGFALEAADLGLWDMEVDSRQVERNASWYALLGRPAGSVDGSLDGWRAIVHPDDEARAEAVMEEHFRGESRQWCMQYRLRHGNGRWIWVEDRGRVVDRWPDGRARRAMGVVQDVTDRVEIAAELERTRHVAERSSEAKSRFLANMSHEIRTPLTAVLGYAELARDEASQRCDDSDDRLREHLEVVLRNGRHLSQLLDEVLDLSKIEAGELRVDFAPMDVAHTLGDVHEMLIGTAREKGLELCLDLPDALPSTILSDGLRVRQILVNLVGNALKFTPAGRVVLRARAALGADRVLGRELPGELHIEVVDQAGGIDEATLATIFEPFVQGDPSTTRRFGGTGLGLAISRNLAQLVGGEVRATSRIGDGSTFGLYLPLDVDDVMQMVTGLGAPRRALPSTAVSRVRGAGGRILLAEDGADNRRLVGLVLERAGFAVETVEDGRRAVEAVQRSEAEGRPFDVVLMDVQMPVLDGYAATRELRARGLTLPVVALTANAFADERARCLEAGCDDHTTKPIDREALVASVERWIAAGRERAASLS